MSRRESGDDSAETAPNARRCGTLRFATQALETRISKGCESQDERIPAKTSNNDGK
jgi:hypothetical protein